MGDKTYVSVKDLAERLDIHAIEVEAREQWEKTQRGRRRLEQWLIQLLPFGLVLMVLIFYGLSAPHTAYLLSLITPTFVGQYLAPIGWELGVLIISAFRELGWRNWLTWLSLTVLLSLSIVINIAGGFISVVYGASSTDLGGQTFAGLISQFNSLPAATQIVLLLVVPIGAVIPVMAKLAGEAVVKLALGKVRLEQQSDEERWTLEAARVMYSALLQSALKEGAGAKTAGNWSQTVVDQMYAYRPSQFSKPPRSPALPAGQSGTVSGLSTAGFGISKAAAVQTVQVQNDKDDSPDSDSLRIKKSDVLAWLTQNGTHDALGDRDVCKLYMRDRFGIETDSGYKTIQRARREIREQKGSLS